MLSLPIAFSSAIGVFAPVFSRPVWQHVKVLLTGAVLAPLPFLVGQVAWICFFVHTPRLHNPRRLFRQARSSTLSIYRNLRQN